MADTYHWLFKSEISAKPKQQWEDSGPTRGSSLCVSTVHWVLCVEAWLWGVWFTTRQEQGKTSRAYEERSPCFPPGLLQEQTGEGKNHSTVHSAEERHMTLLSERDKHFSLTKTTGKDWQLHLNEDYLPCRTENWCKRTLDTDTGILWSCCILSPSQHFRTLNDTNWGFLNIWGRIFLTQTITKCFLLVATGWINKLDFFEGPKR